MPRLLYIITGIILIGVWLGIAVQFAMTLQSAEASNENGYINTPANVILSGGFSTGTILFFLSGSLNTFDPSSGTLSEHFLLPFALTIAWQPRLHVPSKTPTGVHS